MKPLMAYLSAKLPTHLRSEKWFSKETSEFKGVGLLLNERIINVPPSVVAPLLMMLLEEIETVTKEVRRARCIESLIPATHPQIGFILA